MDEKILEKWKVLIKACKDYYIDSVPTGLTDSEFDELEDRAVAEDGFFARDYVFSKYLKGKKTKNSWIQKIKKTKVEGISMLDAILRVENGIGEELYYDLKYDGASLAIYVDPKTGKPVRVVTVGNLNIDNYGVDQTWKLLKFLPPRFPKGIVAIQAEALIDISRLPLGIDPDTARQKANGLVNSKNEKIQEEVDNLLTIRAYRYYTDNSDDGNLIKSADYRQVLSTFETTYSPIDNHILFSAADVWTTNQLRVMNNDYTESQKTITSTGTFLNDGWVVYNKYGYCLGALKYSGAGSDTEVIKTTVQGIQWNSQLSKGKDSWSANVLIDPVTIKGCTIKKPSAGSANKLISLGITPGATVSIILANSTIPMVGKSFSKGNGDYQWPTCSCGYKMSEKDIYGSNLKCGNLDCSERRERMKSYIDSLSGPGDLDLNKFLVIDRFKWETTNISIPTLLGFIENKDFEGYCNYLSGFLSTDLQRRNLSLVVRPSFRVLLEKYEKEQEGSK